MSMPYARRPPQSHFCGGKLTALMLLLLLAERTAADPPNWQPQRRVVAPTRLDWEFAAGPLARLGNDYDSRKQRYQLHVPPKYEATKRWPLVLFLAPGDVPQGWSLWRQPCELEGWFFAAPIAIGNHVALAQRVRATLDVLDDVRRLYRIDPDRTYLVGQGEAARVAGQVAFALPECFGGVVALDGDLPLPRLSHLRHRLQQRLSIALISNRPQNDPDLVKDYLAPLLKGLKIRHQHWHLGPRTLGDVQRWLETDLPSRQADSLRDLIPNDQTPTRRQLSERGLEYAITLLKDPESVYRAAVLLEWVVARCGITEATGQATALLDDLRKDADRAEQIDRRSEAEARDWLRAQAAAHEQAQQLPAARRCWDGVARLALGAELRQAEEQIRRLDARLQRIPWLGLTLTGNTTMVKAVGPDGPAASAGLRVGDVLLQLEGARLRHATDLNRQLRQYHPGDELTVTVRRGQQDLVLKLRVGAAGPLD